MEEPNYSGFKCFKCGEDYPNCECEEEMELNKVYNEDCIQGLKRMPDKSVDLILTDPPYGVNLAYDVYQDTEENWYELMAKFIPEAKRVAKMVIMPSCQIKRLKWIYDNFPPDWLICWYKGSTGTAGFIGFNDWEPLLVYGKINTNMHDYFKATPEPFDNGHPCPKPRLWARWIIKRATKENDIVCDPFAGSGSTLSACKELNRRWVGFEISPEYCKIIGKRLSQNTMKGFFETLTPSQSEGDIISVKRESVDSPNSPHDSSTIKEEANFS